MASSAQPIAEGAAWGNPVSVTNESGKGAAVVVCEHASNQIPPHLDGLGLDEAARQSHVAWDPGALPVASIMAATLDAPLVSSTVSRLVYDCNRPPEAESAMPSVSEIYQIPGNAGLSAADRAERVDMVYTPFRETLKGVIGRRLASGKPTAIVTVHSFTPTYKGVERPFDIGILHDTDSRLADAMLAQADAFEGLNVRRNEPYGPVDGVTHTLKLHALPHGLLNVMIEIRNDIIREAAQQRAMADILSGAVARALELCAAAGDSSNPDKV
ncbi:N-formylglutamate amidohydrolase [Nisaea acidiphila]|uniref:N-formylglutamate amidohydrolase n=1 Tax=Nisaea acidiphila TaxID=1862145 RepID=A0A9J7AP73_9PROT|nr:N-formylglutamate amidohydrolase [Nisaea acidiphila]UUX49419.1 N-formylglutamate amidohydrolase [Nisaea acidiphila]